MPLDLDIPRIETERLLLRGWREDDIAPMAAMNADEETMRYIGPGGPVDAVQTWRGVAAWIGHWVLRGYGIWAVEEKASGRMVGRVGLYNPDGWPGLEVGWLIERPSWGQGYAVEAGGAALRFAWETVGADRVISLIRPDNHRSIRVAEKLGERPAGEIDFDGPALVYAVERA